MATFVDKRRATPPRQMVAYRGTSDRRRRDATTGAGLIWMDDPAYLSPRSVRGESAAALPPILSPTTGIILLC